MILELLFGSAAKAILSKALDLAVPQDKVRKWLGRDPQQIGLQVALSRAYATFARTYPQWTQSFFDLYFLQGVAAPMLARCLSDKPVSASELAQTWIEYLNLGAEQREKYHPEIEEICADFLRWFMSELRMREEFRPLFDSMSLASLEVAIERMDERIEQLQSDLEGATALASQYGSVARQAIQLPSRADVHAKRGFQIFYQGDYASLEEYYIPPDEVFERTRLDDFTGRNWLKSDIDRFLEENDRGVWLLVGEAGVGKTTLLAHLVQKRSYLHFFAETAPGDLNLPRAWQSLASQLIARYQLEPYFGRDTFPQALGGYPDFLNRLIRAASEKLGAGERLVIAIDALDEAGVVVGGNVLGLPSHLPPRTYLILSQRRVELPLSVEAPFKRVDLQADNKENLEDIAQYVQRIVAHQDISEQLRDANYAADKFVGLVTEKSGGNWMYVHYVMEEVRRADAGLPNLEALPRGLVGYFAQLLNSWRNTTNWDRFYGPLLASLAVAFEPIPLRVLRRWSGVSEDETQILRVVNSEWGAFVYRVPGVQPRFRLYHASLRRLFDGEVDSQAFPPGLQGLLDDLTALARSAHRRIAVALGDVRTGLVEHHEDEDYARHHLSAHLRLSGQLDDLFALIDDREWYQAQVRFDPSGVAYRIDIDQAWRAAEDANIASIGSGHAAFLLGVEVRCALSVASLNSLSHNLPPDLLVALVKAGRWTPERALLVAQQNPEAAARGAALAALGPFLEQEIIGQAVAATRAIKDRIVRSKTLLSLAASQSEPARSEILAEALENAMTDEQGKASSYVFQATLAELSLEFSRAALTAVLKTKDSQTKADMLLALGRRLSEPFKTEAYQESFREILSLEGATEPSFKLIEAVPDLPDSLQEPALTIAKRTTQPYIKTKLIAALLERFNAKIEQQELPSLASQVRESEILEVRLRALSIIGAIGNEPFGAEVRNELLAELRAIQDEERRATTFKEIAPWASGWLLAELTALVADMKSAGNRVRALVDLVPRIGQPHQGRLLVEAMILATTIRPADRSKYSDSLSKLLLQLPSELHGWALDFARSLGDRLKVDLIVSLIPRIQQPLANMLVRDALTTLASEKDDWSKLHQFEKFVPFITSACEADALALSDGMTRRQSRLKSFSLLLLHAIEPFRSTILERIRSLLSEDWTDADGFSIDTIVSLIPHVPASYLDRILLISQSMGDDTAIRFTSAALLARFPEHQHRNALLAIEGLNDSSAQQTALKGLIPNLQLGSLEDAVRIALQIGDVESRCSAILSLVPVLPEPLRRVVLQDVLDLLPNWSPNTQVKLLKGLAQVMYHDIAVEAVAYAGQLPDKTQMAEVLVKITPQLPDSHREVELSSTLRLIGSVSSVRNWALKNCLIELIPFLPPDLHGEATTVAKRVSKAMGDADALLALLPHLAEPERATAIVETVFIAGGMSNEWQRAQTLQKITPLLPVQLQGWSVALGMSIGQESIRSEVLVKIFPHLNGELQALVTDKLRATEDQEFRAKSLCALIPHSPESDRAKLFSEALADLRMIQADFKRFSCLKAMVTVLPVEMAHLFEEDFLGVVEGFEDQQNAAEALFEIAMQLPSSRQAQVIDKAISTAGGISDPQSSVRTLARMVERLQEPYKTVAVQTALEAVNRLLSTKSLPSDLVTLMAAYLPSGPVAQAIVGLVNSSDKLSRSSLIETVNRASMMPVDQLYTVWRESLRNISSRRRAYALGDLPPFIPIIVKLGGSDAVVDTFSAVQRVASWWP